MGRLSCFCGQNPVGVDYVRGTFCRLVHPSTTTRRRPMHPREMLLGMVRLYQQRGEPIPIDVLAEADRLGLSVTQFDQPLHNTTDANLREGDNSNGTSYQEDDFQDD